MGKQYEENDRIFGNPMSGGEIAPPAGMNQELFEFMMQNDREDAKSALKAMKGPVSQIWGASDLNVDASRESKVYGEVFAGTKDKEVVVVPDATHVLFRAWLFNYRLESDWPVGKK